MLQRAQHAQRVVPVAFERQHGVDDVLERARPGERAVLGDVADEQRRDPELLGQPHAAVARRRAPARPTRPRPARRDPARPGSSRSRARRGAASSACAQHRRQRRFARRRGGPRSQGAEPVGAQPHLRGRLLAAHEQAAGAAGGHRAERLEQQRALAHARLAADERDRARDQPAAEHPVELRQPGGRGAAAPRGSTSTSGTGRGQRGAGPPTGRRTGGADRPSPKLPHSPQSGAAAEPLRRPRSRSSVHR